MPRRAATKKPPAPEVDREAIQRDLTETLLRLKLARSERNKQQIQVCEDRMNRLLDKLVEAMPT